MNSGLYGVMELQTNKGRPDYLERSLSPVASRANSRAGYKNTRPALLKDLGPGPARTLVEALSNPELLHILKRWQIHHPTGVPLSFVERASLVELAYQNEVALCYLYVRRTYFIFLATPSLALPLSHSYFLSSFEDPRFGSTAETWRRQISWSIATSSTNRIILFAGAALRNSATKVEREKVPKLHAGNHHIFILMQKYSEHMAHSQK